ncbi:maleylpyruvate isomerase family mycothiol-dependent enzyme [Antrihabitans sp. YC2-6]|uniref:maleylpyruvate isomerase family mycothiol-dependent enzyme n=1 Tax=Antrihabitans sp. YC2-6 TaxID=2799498 RepID=UPI0018F2C728|nr:maleylpyruvate isomerase family mycothiol-dependent enzyme [Antrihabitans sp. YC2-6]MBJ8346138.1 maleylpyruvate isomerase family mycothiol-dependent enzyme [Antrihabitans sp. YC2-6]
MSDISELIDDLRAEWAVTDELVAHLRGAQWKLATPSVDWQIRDQIAHLATTDAAVFTACKFADTGAPTGPAEMAGKAIDPTVLGDSSARLTGRLPRPAVMGMWRGARNKLADELIAMDQQRKIAWFGNLVTPATMAKMRLMETWAHTVDISDTLGREPAASERLRHIAELAVANQRYSFEVNDLAPLDEHVRVELTLPGGEAWVAGPPHIHERIIGDALEFCLVAVKRRHPDDTELQAVGPAADRWLQVLQAFTGKPGPGREPRLQQ